MAAPPEKTIKDLNGQWILSKSLSTDPDATLSLQGIGWLTRKAISLATVTLVLREFTQVPDDNADAGPTVHIDFDQVVTGGLKGTTEKRCLDYTWRGHTDHLFGSVQGRSRFIKFADIRDGSGDEGEDEEDKKWLEDGWSEESKEGEFVESFVKHDSKGWTARQVWGFAEVEGKRMHVRKVVVRKGKDVKRLRLVYDWKGPLPNA